MITRNCVIDPHQTGSLLCRWR